MKKLIVVLFALFIVNTIFAQNYTQTVKGKIIDVDNHMPLIGVTVILMNSDPLVGTITDIEGNFKLENIPVGRQSFKFSYMGYEETYRSNIMIATG